MASLGKVLIVAGIFSAPSFSNWDILNKFVLSKKDNDVVLKKPIIAGATFGAIMSGAGIATSTAIEILEKAKKVYNLAQINAGKDLIFIYDKDSGNLKELDYEIDKAEKLTVKNISTTTREEWKAEKILIEYVVEVSAAKGIIEDSLYETIVSNGLDERLALALAEMFAWQIDFAGEIQKGDSFKVIYEKKYRDGQYSHQGKISAAEFINNREKFQGFYFSGAETKEGYYDENGNSLQKVFLKAPLQYKYISSGYTYKRFNPVSNKYTPHRGIDYAAPSGTSAVSVGDGTVVQAGWNGEYGISVKVRHNETYTTVYGHFSSLAKGIRVGAKVAQGQVIGYVGSTGMSTGPHLHYEMHKFGSFINPFTEKIPAGEPIRDADKAAFEKVKGSYQPQLAEL